ncbi:hypothetical protein ACF3NG_06610 [Aerococcaceae bacterium WGS1372]
MKKFLKLSISLLIVFTMILPTSICAQEIDSDQVLLGVINSLKDMRSFKGEYDGAMFLEYSEGTVEFTAEGVMQLKVLPELELGFDLNLLMDTDANDGSKKQESLMFQTYLIDQKIYILQDDSTVEDDGQWQTMDAKEIGYDIQQIAQQYQMIISILEGVVRSYYLPSDVYNLISDKTTIETINDGYSIVIRSFETEEEWLEFFEALERLQSSTSDQVSEGTGVDLKANIDKLDGFETQAKALAEGLTYTMTISTDSSYFIESIDLIVDTQTDKIDESSLAGTDSDSETPKSVKAQFNYQLNDKNFESSIDIPEDLPN